MATASSSTSSAVSLDKVLFYSFNHTCDLLCIGTKNYCVLWQSLDEERREWKGAFKFYIQTDTARPVRMEGNFPSDLVPVRYGKQLVLYEVDNYGRELSQCVYHLQDDIVCLKFNYHFMVVCMRNEFFVVDRSVVMAPRAEPFFKYKFDAPLRLLAVAVGTETEPGVRIAFPTDDVRGCVKVFNVQDKKISCFPWGEGRVDFIAISPNGKFLAAGKRDERYIAVIKVDTGDFIYEFNTEGMTIFSFTFNPESTFLAVASTEKYVRIFELKRTVGRQNEHDSREPAFAVAELKAGTVSAMGLVTIPGGWTRLLCVNQEGVIDTFKVPQRAAQSGNRGGSLQTCQSSATTTVTTKVWGAAVEPERAPSASSDEELESSLAEAMEDIDETSQNTSGFDEQEDWALI